MNKTTYYLKSDFIQHFDQPDDLIVWVYRWNNRVMISDELHKLFTNHFNYN